MQIAVLDREGHLVGIREGVPEPGEIPLPDGCDLALDGTYKWHAEQGTFLPLGHGFAKVSRRAPVSTEAVLYDLAKGLGSAASPDVREWMAWYEAELLQREQEQAKARRIRRGGV